MSTLAGNKHPSVHFFPHGPRIFHLSTEKVTAPIRRKWTSKWWLPRRHKKWKHKQKIKDFSIQGKSTIIQLKKNLKCGKIKFIILKNSCSHITSIKTTVRNKLGLFPSPFHISISSRLTLAGAFRGDHVAAFSSAFRSATEKNDSDGYVDAPCPSKVKQRSSTADWLKF